MISRRESVGNICTSASTVSSCDPREVLRVAVTVEIITKDLGIFMISSPGPGKW